MMSFVCSPSQKAGRKDGRKIYCRDRGSEVGHPFTGAIPLLCRMQPKRTGTIFRTDLPVLLVKLRHQDTKEYAYSLFQKVEVQKIDLRVHVRGSRSLAVSNDFGTVDIFKPFQPFGAQPVNGASFTVGSKEVFKKLESVSLDFDWQNAPNYYQSKTPNVVSTAPKVSISYLSSGQWSNPAGSTDFATQSYPLGNAANATVIESADLAINAPCLCLTLHYVLLFETSSTPARCLFTFYDEENHPRRKRRSTINERDENVGL